jgi:hypothetical protein
MEYAMTRQWLRAAVLILFLGLSQAVWAGPQAWEYTILSQREGTAPRQILEVHIPARENHADPPSAKLFRTRQHRG